MHNYSNNIVAKCYIFNSNDRKDVATKNFAEVIAARKVGDIINGDCPQLKAYFSSYLLSEVALFMVRYKDHEEALEFLAGTYKSIAPPLLFGYTVKVHEMQAFQKWQSFLSGKLSLTPQIISPLGYKMYVVDGIKCFTAPNGDWQFDYSFAFRNRENADVFGGFFAEMNKCSKHYIMNNPAKTGKTADAYIAFEKRCLEVFPTHIFKSGAMFNMWDSFDLGKDGPYRWAD
jgi:hypothetical protein